MSCFATQLTATLERISSTLSELSIKSGVPLGTLSAYARGTRLPKTEQLEQIVDALPSNEATSLVIARIQDEIGPKAAQLVVSIPRGGGRVEEPQHTYMPADLPEELRRALDTLSLSAVRSPDLRALLVNLAKIQRPPGAPAAAARPRRPTEFGTSRAAPLVSERPA